MKIGVLGCGRMTEALVPHWLAAGHEVVIGGRDPAKAAATAERLGARGGDLRAAAEFGDVILLAVLHAGVEATLSRAGASEGTLAGKVLIDCCNAVEVERFTLVTEPGGSLAERVAELTGARVVKAFNQAHAEVWASRARFDGRPLVAPIAGEPAAKEIVAELVRDAGAEPLDAGGLEQAHNLEAMAAVIIRRLFGGDDPLTAFQLARGEVASTAPQSA